MSWLKDEESYQLFNLDHVEKLTVQEVKPAEPEPLWGLAVWLAGDDEADIVFVGSQEECLKKLEAIGNKLSLIKGV